MLSPLSLSLPLFLLFLLFCLYRSFNYTLSVFDGNSTATAILTVNVLDINDNHPMFQNDTYTFHIPENTPNVLIGSVNATDLDSGLNGQVFSVYSVHELVHVLYGTLIV